MHEMFVFFRKIFDYIDRGEMLMVVCWCLLVYVPRPLMTTCHDENVMVSGLRFAG